MKFGMKQINAPTRCPDCGCVLSRPVARQSITPHDGTRWEIDCTCGVILQWVGCPDRWIRRHRAGPLFSDGATIQLHPA